MVLRLDPRLPAVWRSPTSLQFGVSRPVVMLNDLDLATEKLIAALTAGISRSGLGMIGRAAGASDSDIDTLLEVLAPVLAGTTDPHPQSVVVAGTGRLADRVALLLAESGTRAVVARTAAEAERAPCDLAVAVGHYVLDPQLHGLWLRRDRPHLPVLLGDSSLAIGPFVEPGRTACLYCLQLHARDADPAWPAIASQLWGRRSPVDSELVASEGAAIVARYVVARLGGDAVTASSQLVIEAATGRQSQRSFALHPDCGCLAPGSANAEAQRESDSPAGPAPLTTRATGAFSRG